MNLLESRERMPAYGASPHRVAYVIGHLKVGGAQKLDTLSQPKQYALAFKAGTQTPMANHHKAGCLAPRPQYGRQLQSAFREP